MEEVKTDRSIKKWRIWNNEISWQFRCATKLKKPILKDLRQVLN